MATDQRGSFIFHSGESVFPVKKIGGGRVSKEEKSQEKSKLGKERRDPPQLMSRHMGEK